MNKASQFILNNPRCCIFLRTGYGKTRIAIEAIELLRLLGKVQRVLIIAPKMVAMSTWPDELRRYDIFPNLIMGGKKERRAALHRTWLPYNIINVENIPWLIDTLDKPFSRIKVSVDDMQPIQDGFDCVIIDESSKFKSPTSARFHAIKDQIDEAGRVILMSGTPISNGIANIWSQIRLVDCGVRLGRSFYQFRNRYFYPDGRFKWSPFPDATQIIIDLISDICYSEHDESVVQVEEQKIGHMVELDKESKEIYNNVRQHFIYEWNSGLTLTAPNLGVAMGKMLQICSGSVYVKTDDGNKSQAIHTNKMRKLQKLLKEIDRPAIIVYNFRFELDALRQTLGEESDTISIDAIQRWNKGKLRYLLIHPLSAGHGINLQFGGNTIIWYGLTWSLENYMQTNARVTRRGQKEDHTEIHHILTRKTLEQTVVDRLRSKETTQENFLQGIVDGILTMGEV